MVVVVVGGGGGGDGGGDGGGGGTAAAVLHVFVFFSRTPVHLLYATEHDTEGCTGRVPDSLPSFRFRLVQQHRQKIT